METNQIEIEEEIFNEIPNWLGYNYPLACRVLKSSDAPHLYPVMKKSAKVLMGYIGWAKYLRDWNLSTVQAFVDDHVNSSFPRFHLIFTIGKNVVGFGSLAPMPNKREIQVALWVAKGHQRKGIGSWIVTVLEWYAFHVFGYDAIYYQHDATNRLSAVLPGKLGYQYSHTFEEEEIEGTKESGLWNSHKKTKPKGIPPGCIDTGTLSNWDGITFPWTCLI